MERSDMTYDPHKNEPYEQVETPAPEWDRSNGEFYGKTYRCKTCGGDSFKVAAECYQTYITCHTCGWGRCIHDG